MPEPFQTHSTVALLSVALEPVALRSVPLVGMVAAGIPVEAIEHIEGVIGVDPGVFPENDIFALRVHGDSMLGIGVRDGDIAIINKHAEPVDGDIIIALVNGEATLKRYLRTAAAVTLHAENNQYADILVTPEDDFKVLGVAIGIVRRP